MKKRIISLVMAVVLMISVLQGIPGTSFSWSKEAYAANGVYEKLMSLKSKFPEGKHWNHYVSNSNQLADNLISRHDDSFADTVTDCTCNSHTSNAIGVYDCNCFDGAIQCMGFAYKIFYDVFGQRPTSVGNRYDTSNITVGDYIRINNDSHSAVVIGRDGNTLTVVECNLSGRDGNEYPNLRCSIRWGHTYSVNSVTYFKHASNWDEINNGGDHQPIGSLDNASSSNGKIYLSGWTFDEDNKSKSIDVHVYMDGKCLGGWTANTSRTDVNQVHNCGNNHGYSITIPTKETGQHKITVYAINIDKNGGNGGGSLGNPVIGEKTITVDGDTEKPVISDVEITDKSETGYTVKFKATDNIGILKVQCPTWTAKNDQDDIVKDWQKSTVVKATSLGNNMYQFKVKTSDHNNELGQYKTHIYAYDEAENYVNYSLNSIIVNDTPVLKEDGYYHCKVLAEEITSDEYIIQYQNTYEKVQKDSPGAGWVKGETVKNEWVNSGSQYNNEADLPTSDARILVKHIYYHFCGPNAGNEGNYEQTGKFVHYDEIDDSRYGVRIASTGMDGSHPYYLLNWADSGARVYCKSGVTCDGSYGSHGERCQAWYRWNVYQDRVKVEQYRYTKVSDWVDTKDSTAKSTEVRYKTRCEHDYEVIDSVDATCTEEGSTTYKCSKCGDEYTETEEALGHIEVIDEAVEPTCTETGLTAGVHCSRCEEILTEQEVVKAYGHDEVVVKEVPATCVSDGFTQYTKCHRCGETLEAGEVIPAKGHKWDDGEIVKEATEEESGIKIYTCDVCKEKKYEVIPPIGSEDPTLPLSIESINGIKNEMQIGDSSPVSVTFSRDLLEGESFEWVISDVLGIDGKPVAPGTSGSIVEIDDAGNLNALGAGKAVINYMLNDEMSETSFTVEVYGKYDVPPAPVEDEVTATSISVLNMDGCQYSLDGITWQNENTFTNLSPKTVYTVFARKASKGYLRASGMSKGTIISTVKKDVWPFKDVDVSDRLAPEIRYAYDKGIINGFSAPDENGQVKVKPDQNVTRAQFAIMIYKMAGSPAITAADLNKSSYSDVSSGTAGYAEVVWASSKGIISGFANGQFKPNNNISRSQIAIMLKKFGDYQNCEDKYISGGTSISTYSDYNEVRSGAVNDLQWAVDNGILSGVSSTKMKPNGTSTRGQCAAFCARFYKAFIE